MRCAALLLALMAAPAWAVDCRDLKDDALRLSCYDRQAAQPAPPPPPAAPPKSDTPVQAHLVGSARTWSTGTRFTLDNGQVWVVDDETEGYYPKSPENPTVIITEGFLGSHWMKVDGIGHPIKVHRRN